MIVLEKDASFAAEESSVTSVGIGWPTLPRFEPRELDIGILMLTRVLPWSSPNQGKMMLIGCTHDMSGVMNVRRFSAGL
jgi:hypothetical protein